MIENFNIFNDWNFQSLKFSTDWNIPILNILNFSMDLEYSNTQYTEIFNELGIFQYSIIKIFNELGIFQY